jgi:cysteine desulfurase
MIFGLFGSKKRINLDYASLTPIDKRVLFVMNKYSLDKFANPGAWYKEGVSAKKSVDTARKNISQLLSAHADEIYFTSGGTEANNIAILGSINSLHKKGVAFDDMHIIISAIEHSSVIECANHAKELGVGVDILPVDNKGVIKIDELKKLIRPQTILVSIMMVNNEIGTVQPIKDITKIIRKARENSIFDSDKKYPLLHTDASQAFLLEKINLVEQSVDLLTLDSSKVYGPRGIGALYIRRDTPISPVIFGGGQEKGIRSGTENLPAIMGFAKALEIAKNSREENREKFISLREYFVNSLKSIGKDISINGEGIHIINISIPGIDSEFFVLQLDANGIACSTKSSCMRDEDESYVLRSIGANSSESIRFSFGINTKKSDIDRVIGVVKDILKV